MLGVLRVVNFAAPAFIITFSYKSLLTKRFAVASCSFMLLTTTSSLSPLPFYALYRFFSIDLLIFTDILALILPNIVVLLLRRIKHIRKDLVNLPRLWIPAIIVPGVYVSLEILRIFLAEGYPEVVVIIGGLHSVLIMVGVISLILLLYNNLAKAHEDKLKHALQAQEKDYYFAQCQIMQESVERIKSIRHDMKLHLYTIKGYSAKIQADEIADYASGLLSDIDESEMYCETGNIALDSIINMKLAKAKENNIKTEMRLLVPSDINVEVTDIVIILGNLLDNALDALAMVENKVLKLHIELSKGTLFIKIDNSFDGVVNHTSDNGTASRITTRKNGGSHGYGLKNVENSVNKYNGQLDISYDDNIFSVTIILYVDITMT